MVVGAVVRMARTLVLGVSAILLVSAWFVLPQAQGGSGGNAFALDLLLGFTTFAGLFLTLLVLWSLWVERNLRTLRWARLAVARLVLGGLLVVAALPLLALGSDLHRLALLVGLVLTGMAFVASWVFRRGLGGARRARILSH